MHFMQGAFVFSLLQVLFCPPVRTERLFSVPSEITALEQSCLVIPCTAPHLLRDKSHVFTWCLWRTPLNDSPEVYNNKDSTNVLPRYKGRALLVGDLAAQNCALQINNVTKRDADIYYPAIEQKYDQSVFVKVAGTPQRPKVNYPISMIEGIPVIITCSVDHTCPTHPPALTWDKIKSNAKVSHKDLWGGVWRTELQWNYTPAAEHHLEEFVCSATYPSGKSASESITLYIKYAPKGVHAVLVENPEEGKPMEVLCETKSSNPIEINFTWYKNEIVIEKQESKTLKIERAALGDAGVYHCVVHSLMGNFSSTSVSVNFKYGFPTVGLVIGVLIVLLAAVAIGAIVLTRRHLNNKKKNNNNISTQLTQLPHHDGGQDLYQNVESLYMTLDGTQTTSEYGEIRRNDRHEETNR